MALRGRVAASLLHVEPWLQTPSLPVKAGAGESRAWSCTPVRLGRTRKEDEEVKSGLCGKFNLGCIARLSGGEEEATWTEDS